VSEAQRRGLASGDFTLAILPLLGGSSAGMGKASRIPVCLKSRSQEPPLIDHDDDDHDHDDHDDDDHDDDQVLDGGRENSALH
jgi:hypothetical protein